MRALGIDVGAETVKIVEIDRVEGRPVVCRRRRVEHRKEPARVLRDLLDQWGWDSVDAAAVTGRGGRGVDLERVPTKAALARGVRFAHPAHEPGTVVSIGSHGFLVLELRAGGQVAYRENSRCSQGTGNFLRQLVERFDLDVEEASRLCAPVEEPAALSGRCPVILKTDMTHLANQGRDRAQILAGLYDAVCENVQVLLRPGSSPPRVLLCGGVMQADRVRRSFASYLAARQMELVDSDPEDGLFLEALGAALVALEHPHPVPALDALFPARSEGGFEEVPSLRTALGLVTRMPPEAPPVVTRDHDVVLGFDIGSTGSKAVALDLEARVPLWEGYGRTLGNPVEAARGLARAFLDQTGGRLRVRAVGATGSGREIVGSMMSACFGAEPVFVLNEIAAHAEGALHFDPEVDTIFEIGGQDAKYIRLDGGRISDAAMNEACSAGTGSFIEEQGAKFEGVRDVAHLGELALGADRGVSLGQHCSVFMAEVIDGAVAAGVEREAILAGIYDSIIQNYLNRVKGNRSVGRRIFCQGMPFASPALAAAVARQTGRQVVIPPNPGTIGALGIALLTAREAALAAEPLALEGFLDAALERRDQFECRSTKGCGGTGNHCRIDRLHVRVAGQKNLFLWGGSCSLYDAGTHRRKLPDRAPDPFRERQVLAREITEAAAPAAVRGRIALTDEFALKGMVPFFATFLRRLGYELEVFSNAGSRDLKRGIEAAAVPYCAPMQMYHGVAARMLESDADYVLAPRLRELPRQGDETHAVTCPIVQASPDIVRRIGSHRETHTRLLTPRIDVGPGNLDSARFRASVRSLARELGAEAGWRAAWAAGCRAQREFEERCREIGRKALAFALEQDLVPVVVLGRAYTIYNDVLNSNIPRLLREQGAMAIPVDCYPLDADTPLYPDLYWGYGHANIRAAHQIRRAEGVYAVFASNYSCGPDSFNLHFFSYLMENKPFAVIETDGHAGDAGTKTRLEAFLYCVEQDRRLTAPARAARGCNDLGAVAAERISVGDAKRRDDLVLIPRLGQSAEIIAAVLEAEGIRAEALPMPTREDLRLGRRHTSGKECVPMTITTGNLLSRLERETDPTETFAFLMPKSNGPCRFGMYNLLHQMLLEQTGWGNRVRVITPVDKDYFSDVSADFQTRAFVGFVAGDLLLAALHDVRPVEKSPGAAQAIFDRTFAELVALLRETPPGTLGSSLAELGNGMFGVRHIIARAASEFAAVKDFSRDLPTVALVGEIYVRLDPFANDFIVEKLEERGIRSNLSPFSEWLEYMTLLQMQRLDEGRGLDSDRRATARFTYALQTGVSHRLYREMARRLRWIPRTTLEETLDGARPYLSPELMGEAVLTLGRPLHEHARGFIDGVVAVGPHECMPNKVAEALFGPAGDETGLLSLALPVSGDPLDPEILDRFAFEVHQHHEQRRTTAPRRANRFGELVQALPSEAVLSALRLMAPFTARRQPRVEPRPKMPSLPVISPGVEDPLEPGRTAAGLCEWAPPPADEPWEQPGA